MAKVSFTAEQTSAIAAIERCLAGTGKTTVLAEIGRRWPSAILCTLTGKAAMVLRDKTGLHAQTIHKAFYLLLENKRNPKGGRDMSWDRFHDQGDLEQEIVLLDECSMVNGKMAEDILRTGAKVIACGDPGQLPPVKGEAYFKQPDFTLQEIHRQAQESAIIRQAHAVRETGVYADDGPDFRVSREANDRELAAADMVLCWTHKMRKAVNEEMRKIGGRWQPTPQIGEPMLCLRNMPQYGIFNGGIYRLGESFRDFDEEMILLVDDEEIAVPYATFPGARTLMRPGDEREVGFEFGYCLTVHKAQGSEWPSVILVDEFRGQPLERRKWLYTGITRASRRMQVVR
jgi:exodeoxyribonuclease-5